jgi:hypothetical protein
LAGARIFHCVAPISLLMVTSAARRVSNHEAKVRASSFETPAPRAPQDED